jgi:ribosomal protein S18 acetylase RimI-like enzyme
MVASDRVTPAKFYRPLISQGLIWVAVDRGTPIGFAYCEVFDDELHLWELAVRLGDQRRGAGRALVAAAVEAAQERGLHAITLTTFRDIPWNRPFYGRLGFVEVAQDEAEPRLAGLAVREAAMGLDLANRCAMRRVL